MVYKRGCAHHSELLSNAGLRAYSVTMCMWAYWAFCGPESWPFNGFLVVFRPWWPSRWHIFFFSSFFPFSFFLLFFSSVFFFLFPSFFFFLFPFKIRKIKLIHFKILKIQLYIKKIRKIKLIHFKTP